MQGIARQTPRCSCLSPTHRRQVLLGLSVAPQLVRLAARTPPAAAGDMEEKRELLSTHKAHAVYEGVKHFPCRHLTSLCPNQCGHARDAALFRIKTYLEYSKPGKYGDEKQELFHFDISHVPESQQPFKTVVEQLQPDDEVDIAWVHEYVTKNGCSAPERSVTSLTKTPKIVICSFEFSEPRNAPAGPGGSDEAPSS